MRRFIRGLAALALLCFALPCAAQELAFGGRGEDILYEAAAVRGGGFFAVGTTASADGDLESRTRSGETGWALRADAEGRLMWNYCSGKSGMLLMCAPYVHADGRCSFVLTDETRRRGEWIVLSARGRPQSRVTIPKEQALCADGGSIAAMTPAPDGNEIVLMLMLSHADGQSSCVHVLHADAGVTACGKADVPAGGVMTPCETGGAVYVCAQGDGVSLTRMADGGPVRTSRLPLDKARDARVIDALADGDGSVLVCLQSVDGTGGRILRCSAQDELIFDMQTGHYTLLAETDTGYAACSSLTGDVLFFDEDGAQRGFAVGNGGIMDLLSAGEGVYALSHDAQRGRRQAVFTRIMPETAFEQPEPEEDMPAVKAPAPERTVIDVPLGEGCLRCVGGFGGVTVTCVDASGRELWQTYIPIHTAADRLVWERAEVNAQGDILLHGYYETDMQDGVLREGASALLSAGGVLRRIGTTQEPGT